MGTEELYIAIIGGLVGGAMSLLVSLIAYYYNLRKEVFFRIQEKAELLLTLLYQFQGNLFEIDLLNEEIADDIQTNEEELKKLNMVELKKTLHKQNKHKIFASEHQKLRETILSLIVIYFPSIKERFHEYTRIEINHNQTDERNIETMNKREDKLSEISHQIIELVDKKRRVFWLFKV